MTANPDGAWRASGRVRGRGPWGLSLTSSVVPGDWGGVAAGESLYSLYDSDFKYSMCDNTCSSMKILEMKTDVLILIMHKQTSIISTYVIL